MANRLPPPPREFSWARVLRTLSFWALVIVGCIALVQFAAGRREATADLNYTQFSEQLDQGNVKSLEIVGRRVIRGDPAAPDPVAVSAERGDTRFGLFSVEWRPDPAPARVERGGWTTWLPAAEGWELRPPRAGDRLVPLGGVGRRPLRRLLMEARVPRGERTGYLVVARGETVLWVPGICRAAAEVPAPGTRAVRLDVIRDGEPENGRDGAEADRL
ncbi:MAG: hypothetical protein DMD68_12185 [Gemmatimonadetes bacterium]|nr:MAG: hypothetical protein DMD68_12185 [Gemmatimonadota bacterium]